MTKVLRPHLLGIDDGPFEKGRSLRVPIVGVVMEGPDLVEGVAVTDFPVDGEDATEFLAGWVAGLRFHASLQGIVLGGITIAGLGVVDPIALAAALRCPVLVVNRRDPAQHRLAAALQAAGLGERLALVERAPEAQLLPGGLYLSAAGVGAPDAARIVHASRRKSELPEPLRLAHLFARALVLGESRGRP